jgi:hypothetical protein
MPDVLLEYSTRIRGEDGSVYLVRACGSERPGGTWQGWLEFVPEGRDGATLATGEETSQPNRDAVAYWASGLEPVYLAGALARAQGLPVTGMARDRIL